MRTTFNARRAADGRREAAFSGDSAGASLWNTASACQSRSAASSRGAFRVLWRCDMSLEEPKLKLSIPTILALGSKTGRA